MYVEYKILFLYILKNRYDLLKYENSLSFIKYVFLGKIFLIFVGFIVRCDWWWIFFFSGSMYRNI